MPGSPLTLLSTARLDRLGESDLVLLGTEGSVVRWARLSGDGALQPEHMQAVPAHIGGPWFAVAGAAGPGDRIIIAYVDGPAAAVPGVPVDLMTFSVPFEGGAATTAEAIAQVPDPRTSPLQVAMGSGRGGMQAGIAWAARGSTTISARVLGGSGQPTGDLLTLGPAVGDFDCLRFSPGRQDLTVGYVDLSGTPPAPKYFINEISADGVQQGYISVRIGDATPGCVELVPTDRGYGFAWHNEIGTYFGVFDVATRFTESFLVIGDVRIPGGPPILGGFGWMGRDYAIVFDRVTGAEAWRVDNRGQRLGGARVFPSTLGHVGQLSTQPVGPLLYGTYADYSSSNPQDETAGQRYLVKLGCP